LSFVEEDDFTPLIRCIYETQDGSFWFGWNNGLVKYDLETKEKIIYRHEPGNNKSISNNEVLSICEDPTQPKKYLWVGTQGGGLSRLNLDDGTFSNFSVTDGFPIMLFMESFRQEMNSGLVQTMDCAELLLINTAHQLSEIMM
jgi:hypothetical protein